MTLPLISAVYAGLLALLMLALAVRVVLRRRGAGIGIGTGQDRELERRVRVHGNAVEYVPLALIVLVLAEMLGLAALAVNLCGAALLIGRLLHAWGFSHSAGTSPGRAVGMLLTWLVTAGLALWLVFRGSGLY